MKYKENTHHKNSSNRNLIECGICGIKSKRSDLIKDSGSSTGYLCKNCYYEIHTDYISEEF